MAVVLGVQLPLSAPHGGLTHTTAFTGTLPQQHAPGPDNDGVLGTALRKSVLRTPGELGPTALLTSPMGGGSRRFPGWRRPHQGAGGTGRQGVCEAMAPRWKVSLSVVPHTRVFSKVVISGEDK